MKWNEKAHVLEELNSIFPSLANYDPKLLTNFATNILEDTNSNVVSSAFKTIEYLAEVYSCQFIGLARQLIG
eukprot:CAMPEP_0204912136 /NCGR_PEP_ID=MMETSP1397-20131031/10345_1 /ASSEMBLY_ACC=CAM_ASM_000891 /TAXON_ID=49980 /ORGANISM="Climacostomum Climacostomum virens, Strain Stock W-24" /LENGTH=71 /DNA_ID=CAMNT_0052082957 /DNA_START=198 /DNA_END=410 /DNA_ORIENTATION=+